jgi:hypothetical protein
VVAEQAPKEHGAANIEDQVNDHMEEDDHADNMVEDDGTNTLIHDTFNVRMDVDDDHENDDFDDVHDLPLLEKAYKPLYEGSNINLLSSILLIMNLKVMNGFSNTSITHMLRYVIYFINYIYMIMIKVIFVPLIFLLLVHQ